MNEMNATSVEITCSPLGLFLLDGDCLSDKDPRGFWDSGTANFTPRAADWAMKLFGQPGQPGQATRPESSLPKR